MPDLGKLFTPFSLGDLTLENRIVMAPMTRQKSPGEIPGADVADYYARRAAAGVGLIITEATTVDDPAASPFGDVPAFHGGALPGWKAVCDAVHNAGGRIMPQLWHLGTMRRASLSPRPDEPSIGPSGLLKTGKQISEPMSEARIEQVIDAYARGAADAQALGFDGVEVHGAHGYLIDQFLWNGTNVRADRWGGDMAGRGRFAVEIIRAIRRATRPDFPLVLRWSQWKTDDYRIKLADDPTQLEHLLAPIAEAGVTAFHCSTRRFWEPEFADSGSDMNLAGWTKKVTGLPTITVGSVGLSREDSVTDRVSPVETSTASLERLAIMLDRGDFDLVAVGRALVSNPRWAELVRQGRFDEIAPYTGETLETLY